MPSTTVTEEKRALRARMGRLEERLSPALRRESDAALFARLRALPDFQRADTLFLFVGRGAEPDTLPLVRALTEAGKRVALPRCLPRREMECRLFVPDAPLIPGPFGIPEPGEDAPLIHKGEIGLALVPALCYDRRGYRLGRGGGYYDRWLAGFAGLRAGLCRDEMLLPRVPAEAHDQPVHLVITETLTLPGAAR